MKVRKLLELDEISPEIVIINPGDKSCIIPSNQSGWEKDQVFTSESFPNKIIGIHDKELSKKIGHPVYCLEVSNEKLVLRGWHGYNYGAKLMNKICNELFSIKGICSARSITKSDFELMDSNEEAKRYWLASRCESEYGLYRVSNEKAEVFELFDPDGYEEDYADSIRPIIVINDVEVDVSAKI